MLHIDYRDSRPLYEQIADGFEQMAVCGAVLPEEQLPSVRQLAMELSINPNTIQRAYGELERRGVAYSVKGRGNFVSADCQTLRMHRIEQLQAAITQSAQEAHRLGTSEPDIQGWVHSALMIEEGQI